MYRLCYVLLVLLLASSCRDKVICSAFQSTYILDDSVRATYFSYMWYLDEDERTNTAVTADVAQNSTDSLGVTVASAESGGGVDYIAYTAQYRVPPQQTYKNKNGIVRKNPIIPNIIRNLQLRTTPKENILTPPDAWKPEDEIQQESTTPLDTTYYASVDSTASVSALDSLNTTEPIDSLDAGLSDEQLARQEWEQFKYGFNPLDSMQPDQEYYFKKYGYLLLNKPPEEQSPESNEVTQESDSTGGKGLKGFFSRFKRNRNEESEEEEPMSEEDFGDPENNDAGNSEEESAPVEEEPAAEDEEVDDNDGF